MHEKMTSENDISWSVPFSVQLAEAKCELPKIFSIWALVRIVLAIIVIFIIAFYAIEQYIPDVEFNWIGAFLKCIGMLILLLGMCCAIALCTPTITVSSRGVSVSGAQSTRLYRFDDLAELRIVDDNGEFPLLAFRTREQTKLREYAISPKVSLDELRRRIENEKRRI